MKLLKSDITDYIEFLKKEYSLYISFHRSKALVNFTDLNKYENHLNPYCVNVKYNSHNHYVCVKCQRAVIRKCRRQTEFCGICHCGVKEYIYGIDYNEKAEAYIAVSGYCGNRDFALPEAIEYYDKYICGEPDVTLLHILIKPLVLMIENLISECSYSSEPYYHIFQYVRQNPNISLDDICKKFNYSKSFISHIFKQKCGHSLREYCNIIKIDEAAQLLSNTEMTVTEIAYSVGFNDLSYFISTFKKIKGITPKKYKNI